MNDPIQTPAKEDVWWSNLEGDEIDHNLHGNPPYDVERVANRIMGSCLWPGRVLDMGCGIGRLTNHIAAQLPRSTVYGFDISGPNIHRAVASNAVGLYWHSDGRTIPSGITGVFDLIYSVTMFQHIPHHAKWGYIRQAFDRLRTGGTLIFTVAVGDEPPTFLNHQYTEDELDGLCVDMLNLGFDGVSSDGPDANGWHWVEARR